MSSVLAPNRPEWRAFSSFMPQKSAPLIGIVCESQEIAATLEEDVHAITEIPVTAHDLRDFEQTALSGWDIVLLQCDALDDRVELILQQLVAQPVIQRPAVILQLGLEALDRLFPLAETLEAEIIIGNDRAERLAALIAMQRHETVAERDEETARMLRRMSEQMAVFSRELGNIADVTSLGEADGALASPQDGFRTRDSQRGRTSGITATNVRAVIAARRKRESIFGKNLFADPAWDILLDLYAAHLEEREVSVSSLCIAAAVPPTTALRWIKIMTRQKLLARNADPTDRRRIHMALSTETLAAMQSYTEQLSGRTFGMV